MLLMQEIERLHKTVYSLQWELDQLREENQNLKVEAVKVKTKSDFDKRAIHRLSNHIMLHCEDAFPLEATRDLQEEDKGIKK